MKNPADTVDKMEEMADRKWLGMLVAKFKVVIMVYVQMYYVCSSRDARALSEKGMTTDAISDNKTTNNENNQTTHEASVKKQNTALLQVRVSMY